MEKTIREKGISWMKSKDFKQQRELTDKYYPGRTDVYSLSGREIQHIYESEHKEQPVSNVEKAAKEYEENQGKHFLPDNDKTAFKQGAKWQKEQDKALISELMKEIEGIKRNNEKINAHTWETYKEQINLHLKDAETIANNYINQ